MEKTQNNPTQSSSKEKRLSDLAILKIKLGLTSYKQSQLQEEKLQSLELIIEGLYHIQLQDALSKSNNASKISNQQLLIQLQQIMDQMHVQSSETKSQDQQDSIPKQINDLLHNIQSIGESLWSEKQYIQSLIIPGKDNELVLSLFSEQKKRFVQLLDNLKKEKNPQKKQGLLLYGYTGQGKRAFLYAIQSQLKATIYEVTSGVIQQVNNKFQFLNQLISEAQQQELSIIFMPYIENQQETKFVQQLYELLNDGLPNNVFVVCTTIYPWKLTNIELFQNKFFFGCPNEKQRYQIIKSIVSNNMHTLTEENIQEIAKNTSQFTLDKLRQMLKQASYLKLQKAFDTNTFKKVGLEYGKLQLQPHLSTDKSTETVSIDTLQSNNYDIKQCPFSYNDVQIILSQSQHNKDESKYNDDIDKFKQQYDSEQIAQ